MTITFSTLTMLLAAAAMLHVTEEFLCPGGFAEWYARLVPPKTIKKSNAGFLVWINTFMMCAIAFAAYFGDTKQGHAIWYDVASILVANACFHIWGVFKLKAYSPGIVTAVILYIPIFVLGSIQLVGSGVLPWYRAMLSICLGIGFHAFSIIRQGK
ncbi:MAG: HXXEE domain-containing protein [Ferruginibacter sp.]